MARSSEGRRYRKQPKIDALRQYKEEILEAHRSGLSVHRIAQIFRERGVDISLPHLVRTVRRFVDEEERVREGARSARPASPEKERHPESSAAEATKPKAPVTYQISEQPSSRVQEEEFAKQLRLARYLAAGGSPPSRPLEPVRQPRTPKQAQPIVKAGAKTKAGTAGKKTREEELAKERRRAGRAGHKVPSLDPSRGRSNGLSAVVKSIKSWSINNRDSTGLQKPEREVESSKEKGRPTPANGERHLSPTPAGSASGYAKGLNRVPFVAAPRQRR